MFEQSFLEPTGRTRRPWTVAASFLAQVILIGAGILIPLASTNALPPARLASWFLAPPPPAPPGLPANSQAAKPAPTPLNAGRVVRERPRCLLQFTRIPREVAILVEPPAEQASAPRAGIPGGIGTPENSAQSPWAAMLHLPQPPPAPAPAPSVPAAALKPPVPPAQPTAVSKGVQMAKLIHQVLPAYPQVARMAGLTGIVELEAIIGKDGRIKELRAVSGHPLLIPAALDAVRQWLYSPTLLSGDPVEVVTTIDVNFTLAR
jgi:protein TonB